MAELVRDHPGRQSGLIEDGGSCLAERVRRDPSQLLVTARGSERTADIGGVTEPTRHARKSRLLTEEVFGPVAVVMAVDGVDEAVAVANSIDLGLQGACFTRDVDTALDVAARLRCGSVWINESSRFRLDGYPFGGMGRSGIGREGVRYAMEELSHLKFIGIRTSGSIGT